LTHILKETTPDIGQKEFFVPDISGVVNVYLTSRFFQTVHPWKHPAPPIKIKQH